MNPSGAEHFTLATSCREGAIAAPFLMSLNARDFVRDPDIPIGPGNCVTALDSGVGGCSATTAAILRLHLSTGRGSRVPIPGTVLRRYIAGVGLARSEFSFRS